jgi:hypothetical protein
MRRTFGAIVALGVLFSVPVFAAPPTNTLQRGTTVTAPPRGAMGDSLPQLTKAQTMRMREIVVAALRPDSSLTPATRQEFWRLADRALVTPGFDLQALRDRMVGGVITHPLLVYEDALAALDSRAPGKSASRSACEARLTILGVLPPVALAEAEATVRQAATGDSIRVGGRNVHVSREVLQSAVDNLTKAQARLDALFARP